MIVQSRLGRVKKPKLTKIALTTSSMRLKEVMKVNNPKKLSVSSDEETAISSDSGVLADRLILWAGETAADKDKWSLAVTPCHWVLEVSFTQGLN